MKTNTNRQKIPAVSCIGLAFALIGLPFMSCTGIALSGVSSSSDFAAGIPVTLPDLSLKNDGTYRGSYIIGVPAGVLVMSRCWDVDVTVAGGSMTDIQVLSPDSFPDTQMISTMKARMLADPQSLDVDAFSGATWSSKAFCKAVENALEN